jgi:Flp pilus assembly protein TadB
VENDKPKPARRLVLSLVVLALVWLLLSAGGGVSGAELILVVGAIAFVVVVRLILQQLRQRRLPA